MAVYAFDGTWNLGDQKDAVLEVEASQYGPDPTFRRDTVETNVHRFCEFVGRDQCEYLDGVGTGKTWRDKLLGGAFGYGGRQRIREMYRRLCERYHGTRGGAADRTIDIVGFSRGAALAVHFANLVNERGIPLPRDARTGPQYDRLLGWSWRMPAPSPPASAEAAPVIRFLGLWDAVASIGFPIGHWRNRPSPRWRLQTIPPNVRRSFHAMALDEVRATFELIRPQYASAACRSRLYELWFRGSHSNVGGGYPDRGLSDIPLAWMLEMYAWTLDKEHPPDQPLAIPPRVTEALIRLQPDPVDEAPEWAGTSLEVLAPNADGELGRPAAASRQAWRALTTRELPASPLVHHSVYRRTPNLLLDHYSANRRLLRPLPGDALPVYDPPFFYGRTPRQEARDVARDAFHHIPVRASDWLQLAGRPVVRSDDWVGTGARREGVSDAIHRDTFVELAFRWLEQGRCTSAVMTVPATVRNYDGDPLDARATAVWVVNILLALEPYVPRLRAYQAAIASGPAATGAPVVGPSGAVTTGPVAPAGS